MGIKNPIIPDAPAHTTRADTLDGPPAYDEAVAEAPPQPYTSSPTRFTITDKPLGEMTGEHRYITLTPSTALSNNNADDTTPAAKSQASFYAHFPQSREMYMSVHHGASTYGSIAGTCTFRTEAPIGVDMAYSDGGTKLLKLEDLRPAKARGKSPMRNAHHDPATGQQQRALEHTNIMLDVGFLLPGQGRVYWELLPKTAGAGASEHLNPNPATSTTAHDTDKDKGKSKAKIPPLVDLALVDDHGRRFALFVTSTPPDKPKSRGSSKTGEDRKEDWGTLELLDGLVTEPGAARDRVVVSLLASVEMHRRIVGKHSSWTKALGEGSGALLGIAILGACTVM